MSSKKNIVEEDYISFHRDLSNKMSEKILHFEPKFRIKLCAILYHHKSKQNLDKDLHQELLKLKRNYEKKTYEIIKQMNQLIKEEGTLVLNDFADISNHFTIPGDPNYFEPLPYPKIQKYWSSCLKNCTILSHQFTKKDEDIAEYLETIEISREDTKTTKSFTLSFQFSTNQKYFTNPFVQVTFYLIDSVNAYRQESNAEFKIKAGNKETSLTGIFLQLFQNVNLEEGLNKISDAHDFCTKLGRSYEIALIFKDELIPYSLEYYLNARTPNLKQEMLEKQLMEQYQEKKKPKSKFVQQQQEEADEELADEQYLEDNQCKQQ
ncbi:hypothetical protein ABPG72_003420 [Tetrahymena utriculariae]